jgi:hypothetical protein
MVVQRTINNLNDRPHDERKTIASGIAVGVVVVLLIGWGFLFLRKIQKGTMPTLEGNAVPQDLIDAAFIQQSQQQINQYNQNSTSQFEEIRDNAAASQAGSTGSNTESVSPNDNVDGFGAE